MSRKNATGVARGAYDCDGKSGYSRRSFMKTGAVSFLGLSLMDLMKASALAEESGSGKCDSVILVWLAGGPSHIDTFDPKPGKPTGGPIQPINTSADGIQISEHLPTIAKNMKHAALIRSLTSKEGSHERATYEMHTGYKPLGSITHPSLGSIVTKELPRKNQELPAYVAIGGANLGFGAGFLGATVAPFYIGDPYNPLRNLVSESDVNAARFDNRVNLLRTLDMPFAQQKRDPIIEDYAVQFREAVTMMRSKSIEAFDLRKESGDKLAKYGNNGFGRSLLIAKRLVQSGVRFVECTLGGWDTHADAFKNVPNNCKTLDPALGNLIEDLKADGKLSNTLIICTGEFGRTPQINAQSGRDHYPRVWSGIVAGGGVKTGIAYGSSSDDGGEVRDNPVVPGALHATMFELLGINCEKENHTDQGRPIRLVEKEKPIKGLIA